MRIYKSYPKAFLFEIIVASLTLFGVALWGIEGIILIALFGLRPLILEVTDKEIDETFRTKHYNILKLSIVLTAVTIIAVYCISDLFYYSQLNADFFLRMILPYFILIHGCVGTLFFRR